jgi:dTDP-4-dehydrorhamnose 3,5-epimerase-like enzyme
VAFTDTRSSPSVATPTQTVLFQAIQGVLVVVVVALRLADQAAYRESDYCDEQPQKLGGVLITQGVLHEAVQIFSAT